eukprot:13069030-Alexandrium_andersonii.AAC.1
MSGGPAGPGGGGPPLGGPGDPGGGWRERGPGGPGWQGAGIDHPPLGFSRKDGTGQQLGERTQAAGRPV